MPILVIADIARRYSQPISVGIFKLRSVVKRRIEIIRNVNDLILTLVSLIYRLARERINGSIDQTVKRQDMAAFMYRLYTYLSAGAVMDGLGALCPTRDVVIPQFGRRYSLGP